MDNRLRVVEHLSFHTVKLPSSMQAVTLTLAVLERYREATRLDPTGHGLGAPDPLLTLAFLRGVVMHPLTEAQKHDGGLQSVWAAVFLVYNTMMTMTPSQLEMICEHFHVWSLPDPVRKQTMVQYRLTGTISVPGGEEEMRLIQSAALAEGDEQIQAAAKLASAAFTVDLVGIPVAAGARATPLQHCLTRLLCQIGGTKDTRAPRSSAVWALKGKGKGRAEEEEMEDYWHSLHFHRVLRARALVT